MNIDSVIDEFIQIVETSRKVKVGVEKVINDERKGFLGFFKVWKPWFIERDVKETKYYKNNYVDWKNYAQDFLGKGRAAISKSCESAKNQAKANSEIMQKEFINKLERLNERIAQIEEELANESKKDKGLKNRIDKNKKLSKEIDDLNKQLSSILEL